MTFDSDATNGIQINKQNINLKTDVVHFSRGFSFSFSILYFVPSVTNNNTDKQCAEKAIKPIEFSQIEARQLASVMR